MKVHLVKIQDEEREYMCLNELEDLRGCQMCSLYGPSLVESKLKPPTDISDKCKICDETLINFLDLPNEQKTVLWDKEELNVLIEKRIYCPKCRLTY